MGIERRAFPAGPYTFLRQSTEVAGKISFVLYVKVSNDPGSKPIPVQSRDYTALAGRVAGPKQEADALPARRRGKYLQSWCDAVMPSEAVCGSTRNFFMLQRLCARERVH